MQHGGGDDRSQGPRSPEFSESRTYNQSSTSENIVRNANISGHYGNYGRMSPMDIYPKSKTPIVMQQQQQRYNERQQYEESKENMSAADAAYILAQKRSKTPQDLPLQTYDAGGGRVNSEMYQDNRVEMSKSFNSPGA